MSLFWIRGVEKSWNPFVQNRVSEIRKLLNPDTLCWYSYTDNPADIPSRGLTPKELASRRAAAIEAQDRLMTQALSQIVDDDL